MKISAPCIITSRLLPGLRLADGSTISIEYSRKSPSESHRVRYRYHIDGLPRGESYSGDDLQTGCHHSLQSALASLLSFLTASAESYAYDIRRGGTGWNGENSDMFPQAVVLWAHSNSDELSMLAYELEEGADIIAE